MEPKIVNVSSEPKPEQSDILYMCELVGENKALPLTEVNLSLKNKIHLNYDFDYFPYQEY